MFARNPRSTPAGHSVSLAVPTPKNQLVSFHNPWNEPRYLLIYLTSPRKEVVLYMLSLVLAVLALTLATLGLIRETRVRRALQNWIVRLLSRRRNHRHETTRGDSGNRRNIIRDRLR